LDQKLTEEELRKRSLEQQEVGDEVSNFEDKVKKNLEKDGKIEVVDNTKYMMDRRKELERGKEGEAEVQRGVNVNVNAGGRGEEKVFVVSPSSSPQERVGGLCRFCGSAACGRAGTGKGSYYGYGCLRCSYPLHRRFSF